MYTSVMERPFLVSGSLHLPVGWSAAAHSHPHAELLLVAHGAMSVDISGSQETAGAGDLLLYPPGAVHRERNAGRRALELIYVHGSLDAGPGPRLVDRHGRLGQLVRWLVEDQAAGRSAETLAGWMAMIRIEARRCRQDGGDGIADAIRARLRAQLFRRHGVGELARSAGLGPRQLLRRYRAETGSTPMADLRRMRCERAADLLVSTDWTLARIAQTVGFCDAFHFSKVFRSRYGTPPGRMRRRGSAART